MREMTDREPHKLEPHDLRYAEGKRVADTCRECGQPIWRVYHGPHANHTIEPRADRGRAEHFRELLARAENEVRELAEQLEQAYALNDADPALTGPTYSRSTDKPIG